MIETFLAKPSLRYITTLHSTPSRTPLDSPIFHSIPETTTPTPPRLTSPSSFEKPYGCKLCLPSWYVDIFIMLGINVTQRKAEDRNA